MRLGFLCGVFAASFFYLSSVWATMDPWYSVQNIDNLEINIHFDESSLQIKNVYQFHLGLFGEVLKANPELGLVISHGDSTPFSKVRADHLYKQFIIQDGTPMSRVFINNNLPERYKISKGERLLIYLKKLSIIKKPIVVKKPAPIVIESDTFIVEPEGGDYSGMDVVKAQVREAPIVSRKKSDWSWYLGLGYRDYDFVNRDSFLSYALDLGLGVDVNENMRFKLDLQAVYPDVEESIDLEYDVKVGFDTTINNLTLNSRIYYKNNFIWVSSLSEFDTVSDYGLSQRIEFNLFKLEGIALKMGFTGEVSFSNNFSKIKSANVYSYTTDIQVVFRNYNLATSVYFSKREYTTRDEVLDVGIFGVSLIYSF